MKIYSYILILMLLALYSCDDFLSERPEGEFQLKTIEAFNELLFGEVYLKTTSGKIDYLAAFMSDDLASQYPNTSNNSGHDATTINVRKPICTWQPNAVDEMFDKQESIASATWSDVIPWGLCFRRINRANAILTYAEDSEGIREEKDIVLGEAYALRAFYYFSLVNYYALPYTDKQTDPNKNAGVPIVLSPDIKSDYIPRSSVAEVYDVITSDIEEACKLLEKQKREKSKYRIHHVTAHLLASRFYLHMGSYEKALAHAKYVVERKELTDFTGLMPQVKSWNDDSVLFRENNPEILWCYGTSQSWNDIIFAVSTSFQISPELYALYSEEGKEDSRRTSFFFVEETTTGYPPVSAGFVYHVRKFKQSVREYGQGLRIAEAYLNGIEAAFHLYKEKGDQQALVLGLDWFNDFLRKRIRMTNGAILPMVTERDADKLIEMCRLERRKEFCFEGQRWFDLRRYGMPRVEKTWFENPSQTDVYVLEERDPMYVLDIPERVTELNPLLEQNPSASMGPRVPLKK